MGFVPQPVLAAVVAALATVASLSCADSHHPDPAALHERPPSTGQAQGPVQDVVRQTDRMLDSSDVARRIEAEERTQAGKNNEAPGRA